mmetsp:Transcript_20170/g.68205  ORF Transcript_20170/g.68205 Transcript_20170/m.68205 type:complete len:401 (+) Transcript_20170:355-1557(+)
MGGGESRILRGANKLRGREWVRPLCQPASGRLARRRAGSVTTRHRRHAVHQPRVATHRRPKPQLARHEPRGGGGARGRARPPASPLLRQRHRPALRRQASQQKILLAGWQAARPGVRRPLQRRARSQLQRGRLPGRCGDGRGGAGPPRRLLNHPRHQRGHPRLSLQPRHEPPLPRRHGPPPVLLHRVGTGERLEVRRHGRPPRHRLRRLARRLCRRLGRSRDHRRLRCRVADLDPARAAAALRHPAPAVGRAGLPGAARGGASGGGGEAGPRQARLPLLQPPPAPPQRHQELREPRVGARGRAAGQLAARLVGGAADPPLARPRRHPARHLRHAPLRLDGGAPPRTLAADRLLARAQPARAGLLPVAAGSKVVAGRRAASLLCQVRLQAARPRHRVALHL